MIIDVNTLDLRRALQSVIPHAASPKAVDDQRLAAVNFTATPENLFVTATNRYTLGNAIASVWEHDGLTGSPEADSFTVSADTAKELLSIFKSGGKTEDGEIGEALRITVDDGNLTFLDVAGLFPGKLLQLPRQDAGDPYPVPWARMLLAGMASEVMVPDRIATTGKYLRLFASAAAAYNEPLLIEPTGEASRILISCGESFLGILMPVRASDETELAADLQEWRQAWHRRLPGLALAGVGGRQ